MFFQNFLLEGHTVQVLYLSNNQHLISKRKKELFHIHVQKFINTKL